MSTYRGAIDVLGPESKITLQNLALSVNDLAGALDFSNSLSKDNAVMVEYLNGKYVTKIRLPNNVRIYKKDLIDIPLLLEIISQKDLKGSYIELKTFSTDTQSKIALCFMQHHGYVRNINNELFFTSQIRVLFNTEWWLNLFNMANQYTLNWIDEEVFLGNQPVKNRELIVASGYISVEKFKNMQPEAGMDILWALSIYFFDKIIRNWEDKELPEIIETETIMDIDINPGKYIKSMDAKTFFITQLQIYLQLRPANIFFGGSYFSRIKEYIQKKASDINKSMIMEELTYFTNWMNLIYSGGNNQLNGTNDSGTEPFTVQDVVYSETDTGNTTDVILTIVLKINTYQNSAIYTLPISTKIN